MMNENIVKLFEQRLITTFRFLEVLRRLTNKTKLTGIPCSPFGPGGPGGPGMP